MGVLLVACSPRGPLREKREGYLVTGHQPNDSPWYLSKLAGGGRHAGLQGSKCL